MLRMSQSLHCSGFDAFVPGALVLRLVGQGRILPEKFGSIQLARKTSKDLSDLLCPSLDHRLSYDL